MYARSESVKGRCVFSLKTSLKMLRLPVNLLESGGRSSDDESNQAQAQRESVAMQVDETTTVHHHSKSGSKKKLLISEVPSDLSEITSPDMLEKYTLDALKKLCKKMNCAVTANSSRSAVCSALISLMSNAPKKGNNSEGEVLEEEVHEVYLTGGRTGARA